MSRRLHVLLLVLALLWQPFSALLPAGLDARADRIGHAIVHEHALAHHHHDHQHADDAALNQGVGDPAHQHVLDGLQFPALTTHLASLDLVVLPSGIEATDALLPPSAVPQHLLRPPRRMLA